MSSSKLITTKGPCFIDQQGRQVILHGINLVNKDPATGYMGDETPELLADFRAWGLNCIRLGVIWDGLEPEPGQCNEAYLRGLDERIAWARSQGLYVILDMHQDLYSVLYADGAPEWATLTHGAPHIADSPVWSDAYFSSPAVQTAWDSFWSNAPAPDGIGLQDHYAAAWRVLAARYAAEPHVIGYDLMNEPFPGSLALQAQMLMFTTGAALLAEVPGLSRSSPEDLAALWQTPEGRFALLQQLEDISLYRQIMDATAPLYQSFERSTLMPMMQRVANAVRQVDPYTVLLLETTMASNMGVYSAIEPLLNARGERELYQAYAPHGYDLVTDTDAVAQASPERVRLIFERHAETAKRLAMPMVVDEWGAYGDIPETLPAAQAVVRIFEGLLSSEIYWTYSRAIDRTACFRAVHRPYPERVAGTLLSFRYEPGTETFSCAWQEDGRSAAPSLLYLPEWLTLTSDSVHLNPPGHGFETDTMRFGTVIRVPPTGAPVERHLTVHS